MPNLGLIRKWLIVVGIYLFLPILCFLCNFCGIASSFFVTSSPFAPQPSFGSRISGSLTSILIYLVLLVVYLIPIIIPMILTYFAYQRDKKRDKEVSSDFRGDNLLFRYGYEINNTVLPIPVPSEWPGEKVNDFVDELHQNIDQRVEKDFSLPNVKITPINVVDKELKNSQKKFIRIAFHSERGSQINHFIHYAVLGKSVVIHYITRVRGTFKWYNLFDFALLSPFTIWAWGLAWLRNEYSVLVQVSSIINNSFDEIDLKTFFDASYIAIQKATMVVLEKYELLTEEIKQIIVNNNVNASSINVSNSPGANLSNVGNLVGNVAKRLIDPLS